jgi:hypothetical protein
LRAIGFTFPQKPSFDLVGRGCPVAYVVESLGFAEVLEVAGVALVCGAPFVVADGLCAIAGMPKLAASRIAEIEPGLATLLFTLSPFCRPNN